MPVSMKNQNISVHILSLKDWISIAGIGSADVTLRSQEAFAYFCGTGIVSNGIWQPQRMQGDFLPTDPMEFDYKRYTTLRSLSCAQVSF